MIFNPRYGFVFVHIQKTGGTSVTRLLEDVDGSRYIAPPHLRVSDVDFMAEHRKPVIFAVVRNPWERLVSWYRMMRHKGVHNNFSRYLLSGSADNKSVDFSSFIRRTAVIREAGGEVRDPQAFAAVAGLRYRRPGVYEKSLSFNQVDYMTDHVGHFRCDEVLAFERLSQELPSLLRRLSPTIGELELPWANRDPCPVDDWRAFYSRSEDREFVARVYERDLRHWRFRWL